MWVKTAEPSPILLNLDQAEVLTIQERAGLWLLSVWARGCGYSIATCKTSGEAQAVLEEIAHEMESHGEHVFDIPVEEVPKTDE